MLRTPLSCPPAGLCRYTAPCTLAGEGWPVQVFLDGNFLLQRLRAPWTPIVVRQGCGHTALSASSRDLASNGR